MIRSGSASSSLSVAGSQVLPQTARVSIIGQSSAPASVTPYPPASRRSTMPATSSARSRCVSRVGEMRGTPR